MKASSLRRAGMGGVLASTLLLLAVGCDKANPSKEGNTPAVTNPPPVPATSTLAGHYKAQSGDPAGGGFYSLMTLDLKADGTATSSNTMPDPQKREAKATMVVTTEGHWSTEGAVVIVTMDKLGDGRPVPPEKQTIRLNVGEGGKTLALAGGRGPTYQRE